VIPNKKIILTGTHLTPALAFIDQLKKDKTINWKIFYIGRNYNSTQNKHPSIESKIIPQKNILFYGLNCGKFDRRWFPNTLKGIPQTFSAYNKSLKLIKQIKPDICVSFGGYISVPVVIASNFLKIPSITHEQTNTLSLSTKINSFFTDFTALSFPQKKYSQKQIFTGNLLRPEIYKQKSVLFQSLKISKPIIYITAGNQGSHSINLLVPDLAKKFPKYFFIHQTGPLEFEEYKNINLKNYLCIDYVDTSDIGWILNNSQIIISRSGANTSQEIVALNKTSILIPLPKTQQNEQVKNALWVKRSLPKHTLVVKQNQLTLKKLQNSINRLSNITPKKVTISIKNNPKLLKLCHETLT
jgi:UDP-N-acetylglucosamine--N-acetylmuramyl-(pentapeptide) pyrophosphoryl-undecaprenol N-acetylglucosamine transferase